MPPWTLFHLKTPSKMCGRWHSIFVVILWLFIFIFKENKSWHFKSNVCCLAGLAWNVKTYLFKIYKKWKCRLLQVCFGALRINKVTSSVGFRFKIVWTSHTFNEQIELMILIRLPSRRLTVSIIKIYIYMFCFRLDQRITRRIANGYCDPEPWKHSLDLTQSIR